MRILYCSQYFPPEVGAPAVRVSQMAAHWKTAGVDVRVLTGFPNHPDGIVPAEYRRKLWRLACEESYRGVPVYRTWLYPAANSGKYLRSSNYASFMLSAALRGSLLDFRPDVVIGTSPQLLCAQGAALVARRFGCHFVFEVRDLWPESLEAVGMFRAGSWPYRIVDRIAGRLYRQASKMVVVTDKFRCELLKRGISAEKIAVVKNGVDTSFFHPAATPPKEVAEDPRLRGKFVVSYVGTLGMAHALETVLDAAELLRDETDVHFLLAGGGSQRAALERQRLERRLENVTMLGPRPWESVPGILCASSACLVHLSDSPLFETVLPSKMFEIMAAGRPMILGVRGEARRALEQAGAGLAMEPQSAPQLKEAVLRLKSDPDLARRLGRAGRDFAERHASYSARAAEYLACLKALAADPKSKKY